MGKRYFIDSNILISLIGHLLPQIANSLVSEIIDNDFNISFVNKIEVLGHHSADNGWNNFIDQANVIVIDDDIIEQTIKIRKHTK